MGGQADKQETWGRMGWNNRTLADAGSFRMQLGRGLSSWLYYLLLTVSLAGTFLAFFLH